MTTSTDTSPITLTERAAARLASLAAAENDQTSCLRIIVEGGGCSGFKYVYDFGQHKAAADDIALPEGKQPLLLVDAMSLEFMKGCTIDYIETLGSADFEIINPNSSMRCGCGNSFSL